MVQQALMPWWAGRAELAHYLVGPGMDVGATVEEGARGLRVAGWVFVATLWSGVIAASSANAAATVRNTTARTGRAALARASPPPAGGEAVERVSTSPMTTARTPTPNMGFGLVLSPQGHGRLGASNSPERIRNRQARRPPQVPRRPEGLSLTAPTEISSILNRVSVCPR